MPSSAPTVMMPVPPTPATTIEYGRVERGQRGIRQLREQVVRRCDAPCPRRGRPPSTLTKLGQNPFWQEKSLLHDDWSIARLRPNSVSTGVTDTQFDLVLQSPQPSQTRVLMNERRAGSGNLPRLRRRRFSAAHVWS